LLHDVHRRLSLIHERVSALLDDSEDVDFAPALLRAQGVAGLIVEVRRTMALDYAKSRNI
jgi:hypothetical protein